MKIFLVNSIWGYTKFPLLKTTWTNVFMWDVHGLFSINPHDYVVSGHSWIERCWSSVSSSKPVGKSFTLGQSDMVKVWSNPIWQSCCKIRAATNFHTVGRESNQIQDDQTSKCGGGVAHPLQKNQDLEANCSRSLGLRYSKLDDKLSSQITTFLSFRWTKFKENLSFQFHHLAWILDCDSH